MDFDLRSQKLQKEAEKRRQDAKKKREREKQLEIEQNTRQQQLTEAAIAQRLAAEQEAALAEQRQLEELRRTGGISFSAHDLVPYVLEAEDDRIVLPESALVALSEQDAFRHGPIYLQLSYRSTASDVAPGQELSIVTVTHVGVKEFSATEGTVGLPNCVVDTLWARSNTTQNPSSPSSSLSSMRISVKYVLLPKVTQAMFRPLTHSITGSNIFAVTQIKSCLEESLRFHATLTVGDQLSVWYRGERYSLSVSQLQPEPQGCLIDTDVEVLFDEESTTTTTATAIATAKPTPPPPPTTTATAATAATVATASTSVSASASSSFVGLTGNSLLSQSTNDTSNRNSSSSSSSSSSISSNSSSISSSIDTAAPSTAVLLSELPPEPPDASADATATRIKLPSGATINRRFYESSPVLELLQFVSVSMNEPINSIVLTSRTVAAEISVASLQDRGQTTASLRDLGLGKRELLMATIRR